MKGANQMKEWTWEKLVKVEPRLDNLYRDMALVAEKLPHRPLLRERLWYHGYKYQMWKLVGYEAENPLLHSSDAYHTAYMELWGILDPLNNNPPKYYKPRCKEMDFSKVGIEKKNARKFNEELVKKVNRLIAENADLAVDIAEGKYKEKALDVLKIIVKGEIEK